LIDIDVKIEGIGKLKDAFQRYSKKVKDLSPVWEDFIEHYQSFIIPKTFDSRGGLMGGKWPPFSAAYFKWKRKNAPGKQMLKLKDDMYNAAIGGSGWYQKVEKKRVAFGIKSSVIKYAMVHQEGGGNNIPQRAYFYKADGDLPNRAWIFLIDRLNKHLEGLDGK